MEPQAYVRALHAQFTYLFTYARTINEIDTAAALSSEFRGAQFGVSQHRSMALQTAIP
ncbi:hypothetical protein JCM15831A_09090 [Asaia astilbis]